MSQLSNTKSYKIFNIKVKYKNIQIIIMDMRKEIQRWLEQAIEELETAEILLNSKKYFACAFWCQQSLEKFLKALYMHQKKESIGTTHSLTYLARQLNVPEKYNSFLRNLTKEYFFSRYPDATNDTPYKTYSKSEVEEYLTKTKEVSEWIKILIK